MRAHIRGLRTEQPQLPFFMRRFKDLQLRPRRFGSDPYSPLPVTFIKPEKVPALSPPFQYAHDCCNESAIFTISPTSTSIITSNYCPVSLLGPCRLEKWRSCTSLQIHRRRGESSVSRCLEVMLNQPLQHSPIPWCLSPQTQRACMYVEGLHIQTPCCRSTPCSLTLGFCHGVWIGPPRSFHIPGEELVPAVGLSARDYRRSLSVSRASTMMIPGMMLVSVMDS